MAQVSTVSAALRPARGKLKEDAETQLEVLWQSEDCHLSEDKCMVERMNLERILLMDINRIYIYNIYT